MAAEPIRRTVARRRNGAAPKPPARQPAGRLESILERKGYRFVAGVDEVGRGALAGPLVAAAVLFDVSCMPGDLCDSKVLTPEERERCAADVHAAAVAVSFAVADPADIDNDGLGVANQRALERAVAALRPVPEYVISDWFPLDATGLPHVGLPKADGLSAAVAAASIVAKVGRDAFMTSLDALYPGYGFALHKGYRSPEHWAAIRALGPSPIHRRSFRGVGAYQYSFDDL